jgi:ferrous iron transport protein B
MLRSLVVSGVIDGVGGVLSFVPLILLMFFGIAFLEDSGYLARVAFMLDRVFRIFGLHGNSVMAFIVAGGIAGGCAVPGVMAARTLRSPRERLATLLTVPFMNCGAKLPVFAVLIAAFFAEARETVMFAITLISWAGALLAAKLLRSTVIRGPATPFVMELPPYRVPTLRGLLIHTWERTWQYIKKAGTVILAIAIVLWAMMTFPALSDAHSEKFERERAVLLASASTERAGELEAVDRAEAEAGLRHSVAGRIGGALERVTRWAGFDWRTNIALLGGFGAKEVVVSTLGTAYSLGEVDPGRSGGLAETLASNPRWNRAVAWSLIIFTIFYAPCSVTVVCIVREAGSWKWGAFSVLFNTAVAFALAVLVYQAGVALGAG